MEMPLEEYLAGELIESGPSSQKIPEAGGKERASCQLCLRITPGEKEAFRNFCRARNLRQTDALARLLNTSSENTAPDIRRLSELLEASEAQCAKLTEENDRLRDGKTVPRSERIENHAREIFNFAQQAVRTFVKHTYTREKYTNLPIKEFRYEEFKRRIPQSERYQYPLEEGCYVVKLLALVWGKTRNPMYFVMGQTLEGECLKFRFYQKKEFVGVQVRQSYYALLDSQWLLAGRKAPDGAVDLMAAFPLLYPLDNKKKEKQSLDEQILGAASRK